MNMPSIVDAVEFRRDQYGLTQRDWAKIIGIQAGHYSEFKQGKRKLTLNQAAKCFYYGVPAALLFQTESNGGYDEIKKELKEIKCKF